MSSLKNIFSGLQDYQEYLYAHPFFIVLKEKIERAQSNLNNLELQKKITKTIWQSVDASLDVPFPVEWDDLIRIHYLATSRKVTTVLEFGVGKSTVVLDHALGENESRYGDLVRRELRRSHPFELHSIDNNRKWIAHVRDQFELPNTSLHFSKCRVSTLNGRICTLYDNLPNICPDFIYLDGPDQFSPSGTIRGISTRQPDRLPMAGDIIALEHFLLPGTLVLVDGRSANTRFLISNLQRKWSHYYFEDFDQHLLELQESPLGVFNRKQLEFCLGDRHISWST